MKGSRNVIAVNNDLEGPTFGVSAIDRVGDVHKILLKVIDALQPC